MLKLTFYTNMPTPYQLDFFDELGKSFDLKVVYFSEIERDRLWKLESQSSHYRTVFLKDSFLIRWIQRKYESFHFSWSILKVLFSDRADAVIANGTYWSPNTVLVLVISYLRRKKVAYFSEAVFRTNNPIAFFFKYIMLIPVRWFTDYIFAIGKTAVDSFRSYGYRRKIFNIPYNINTDLFDKESLDPLLLERFREQYARNRDIIFLTSGSLIQRKGVDIIIRAFLKLDKKINASLLILGDGPEAENLRLISENSNRIHFLGFQEKQLVPYFFNISDVFVFASRYDGWALVINEAVAARLPIICSSEVGAAKDSLIDGMNSIICRSESVDDFYHAMNRLCEDDNLRKKFASGYACLKSALSSATNAKKVNDIFSNH